MRVMLITSSLLLKWCFVVHFMHDGTDERDVFQLHLPDVPVRCFLLCRSLSSVLMHNSFQSEKCERSEGNRTFAEMPSSRDAQMMGIATKETAKAVMENKCWTYSSGAKIYKCWHCEGWGHRFNQCKDEKSSALGSTPPVKMLGSRQREWMTEQFGELGCQIWRKKGPDMPFDRGALAKYIDRLPDGPGEKVPLPDNMSHTYDGRRDKGLPEHP